MPRDRGFRDANVVRVLKDFRRSHDALIFRKNPNAIISRHSRRIQRQLLLKAKTAQGRYGKNVPTGWQDGRPLEGVVFAIKDNIATTDLATTCASNILKGYCSPYDATVVNLLRKEGAIIFTKTNMDEFGMGSHSTNSAFGPVKNGQLSVGGSSGGSAFAVASGISEIALGTDTGGSVRLPAAYLGLAGFKPSYGRLSRHGVIPYANSLDTVGILAKNCLDVFLTFQALNEADVENDPTSISIATRRRISTARQQRRDPVQPDSLYRVTPLTGHTNFRPGSQDFPPWRKPEYPSAFVSDRRRRIGFPIEYNIAELHPTVRRAWIRTLTKLELAGHEIVPLTLPSTKAALSAYYVLAPAEASSNLAKYDGVRYGVSSQTSSADQDSSRLFAAHRGALFGPEVKRRILLGAFSLSAGAIDNYFIQAQRVRRLVQQDFDLIFKMKNPLHDQTPPPGDAGVDFIVCPTAPTPPPQLAQVRNQSPLDSYVNDIFTVPASLAGLPAISVPAPLEMESDVDASRFVGMQVIGQYGDDYAVIQFAKQELEISANWDKFRRFHERPRLA